MISKHMIQTAIKAALEAGKILKAGFGNYRTLKFKRGNYRNYLTDIDLKSQKTIIRIIKKNYPGHNIIAEEKERNNIKSINDYYWIIDPLDGTSSFVHNNVYFGISIALYRNNEPIIGVIYNPQIDELFTAEKNKGSFLNKTTKLKCSNTNSIKEAKVGMSWASSNKFFRLKGLKIFYDLGLMAKKIDKSGSCTSNLVGVTNKRFDIGIMGGGYLWDVAAADLIVREAGGVCTTLNNTKINLNFKPQIIITSANKNLHKKIIYKIKTAIK